MTQTSARQPYLHDLLCAVKAPAFALTTEDGAIPGHGAGGVYVSDRRVVSMSTVSLASAVLVPVLGELDGADATRAVLIARGLGDAGADPTVWVERRRELSVGAVGEVVDRGIADREVAAREVIEIHSTARVPVSTALTVTLGCDLADIAQVKSGQATATLPAVALSGGLSWSRRDGVAVSAITRPRTDDVDPSGGRLTWPVHLEPGGTARFEIDISVQDPSPAVVLGAGDTSALADIRVTGGDVRVSRFVEQSLADLRALELRDVADPDDHFIAAGAPWFLTLFGRDSIITARMLLPLGTRLAAGTLRALARRQGTKTDAATAEDPGKILHEIRRAPTDHGAFGGADRPLSLPPLYYGTVDATPLWIVLLHDAWRWGMPDDEVEKLLDPLNAALAWMRDFGLDDAGFLSYVDSSGQGLANQGWKDSFDSIQFDDGRIAEAPLALSEVQGYAYQAAMCGAALLEAFGRPGAAQWRSWAAELAERFRAGFWISDDAGPFPAVALDAQGRPVDSVASNMGHLLGTGILDHDESAAVVARLSSAPMSSGYGLRTMATTAAGYSPLSYHGGSVWTHDTAMAVHGLGIAAAADVPGAEQAAMRLINGLLDAAAAFDYRMPELYGGTQARPGGHPVPYPAACRPQAWAAASSVAVLTALFGIRPDVPGGSLAIQPLRRHGLADITVRGLTVGEDRVDLRLGRDGEVILVKPVGE